MRVFAQEANKRGLSTRALREKILQTVLRDRIITPRSTTKKSIWFLKNGAPHLTTLGVSLHPFNLPVYCRKLTIIAEPRSP
jgi:hypothetical protein